MTSEPTNGRGDKPSASSLHRIWLCPGSFLAERGLPETTSAEASSGTAIHEALATGNPSELGEKQMDMFLSIMRQRDEVLKRFQDDRGPSKVVLRDDRRLWSWDRSFSGLPDFVARAEDGALLVVDYKTGPMPVEPPQTNWQMRGLVSLLVDEFNAGVVRAAIIQPLCGKPKEFDFFGPTLQNAWNEPRLLANDALDRTKASRRPHPDACRYCRANGTERCRESVESMARLAVVDPETTWVGMPVETKAKLYAAALAAEQCAEKIRQAVRSDLLAGVEIPGLALKDGVERRSISDINLVAGRLMDMGVQSDDLVGACSLPVRAVEKLARRATGTSGAELARVVVAVLEGAVEVKKTAPTVTRIRPC